MLGFVPLSFDAVSAYGTNYALTAGVSAYAQAGIVSTQTVNRMTILLDFVKGLLPFGIVGSRCARFAKDHA